LLLASFSATMASTYRLTAPTKMELQAWRCKGRASIFSGRLDAHQAVAGGGLAR
jgi:hypothetical protein